PAMSANNPLRALFPSILCSLQTITNYPHQYILIDKMARWQDGKMARIFPYPSFEFCIFYEQTHMGSCTYGVSTWMSFSLIFNKFDLSAVIKDFGFLLGS
ncbi:MAG: hypothetical protein Q8R79_03995, partial [Legionellaceae bacterium]|nr:hypothetical protein [Legionellaceae bacterium]